MDWKFQAVLARFWTKVDKRGEDECWLWNGTKVGGGYGRLVIDGKVVLAHRFSYELENGKILPGFGHSLVVRHKCDVRSCVNPKHLEVGPQAANVRDMHARGRAVAASMPGSLHPLSKMTEEMARKIKTDTCSHSDAAKKYGFSVQHIHMVRLKCWRHIDIGDVVYSDGRTATSKGSANPNSRLTEDDIRAIRASTERPGAVAKQYGIIPDYVTMIRKRKVWRNVE